MGLGLRYAARCCLKSNGGSMAKTLSTEQWKKQVAQTMAQNIDPTGDQQILDLSIDRYAALVQLPSETLEERGRVVRQAMNDYPQLFSEL